MVGCLFALITGNLQMWDIGLLALGGGLTYYLYNTIDKALGLGVGFEYSSLTQFHLRSFLCERCCADFLFNMATGMVGLPGSAWVLPLESSRVPVGLVRQEV